LHGALWKIGRQSQTGLKKIMNKKIALMYCDAKLGPEYDQTSSSGLNIYCVTSEILKF
jgi:hypothetical protein